MFKVRSSESLWVDRELVEGPQTWQALPADAQKHHEGLTVSYRAADSGPLGKPMSLLLWRSLHVLL